jgi:hypothetical protein
LHVPHRDQVERDVETAGGGDDVVGVGIDRGLVEGVEYRGLDHTAAGPDAARGQLQRGLGAPGHEHSRALAG